MRVRPFSILSGLVMAASLLPLIYLGGMGGCGEGPVSSDDGSSVTLSTTILLPTLPSEASLSSALDLQTGGVMKEATTDLPQEGMTCIFFDADSDKELGRCVTGKDGGCSTSRPGPSLTKGGCTTCTDPARLSAGDHNVVIRVLNKNGTIIANAFQKATVVVDPTGANAKILIPVDSGEDFAYRSWKAACENKLGTKCYPGKNLGEGIQKVEPTCVTTSFKEAFREEAGVTDQETAGKYIRGLWAAHRINLAKAVASGESPVDMSAVMAGDATSITSLGNVAGRTVSALTMKEAVTVDTAIAASTTKNTLDAIVSGLCDDTDLYKKLAGQAKDPSELSNVIKMIKVMEIDKITKLDTNAFKKVVTNASEVGKGLAFFADPYAARSMTEMILTDTINKDVSDKTDLQKRMGVVMAAEAPKSFDSAKEVANGVFNIVGSDNWSSASLADCTKRFAPMMNNQDFRQQVVSGGKVAFDTYIDKFGGITGFQKEYDSLGTGMKTSAKFFEAHKQVGIGQPCTDGWICLPPGTCSKEGICSLGGVSTSFSGGHGTSCTTDSPCATDKGFKCDVPVKICVYAAAQATGGRFGAAGSELKPPEKGNGSRCTQDSQCTTGNVCIHNGCFPPPPTGYLKGSPPGSGCVADNDCLSKTCKGNKCVTAGGWPAGHSCADKGQCSSGNCLGSVCRASEVTTITFLDNGKGCSSPGQCKSGHCSTGICRAQ